jgi:hypothetical protein
MIVAGVALSTALGVASISFAQTRTRSARPASKPKPAGQSADTVPDDKSQDAGLTGAPPGAEPDAGSQGESTDDRRGLSPLNPAANEFSDATTPPPTVDYDRLLTEIAALRARVSAMSDTLFHSRLAVALETDGDHGAIVRLAIALDDGVVWTSPPAFRADHSTVIYDHAVAPGHHAITVDAERRDDRDGTFRSAQRSRFVVDVPRDQRLSVELKLTDESTMGADFPSDKKGRYELRVEALAKAQPIAR